MPQSRRTILGIRVPASLTGILGITACCASGSHNALTVLMDVFFRRNGKAEGTRRRNTSTRTRIDRPSKKAKLYRHRITSVGKTTQMYGRAAATIRVVLPFISLRIDSWIFFSDTLSSADVASSKIKILGSRANALAIEIR